MFLQLEISVSVFLCVTSCQILLSHNGAFLYFFPAGSRPRLVQRCWIHHWDENEHCNNLKAKARQSLQWTMQHCVAFYLSSVHVYTCIMCMYTPVQCACVHLYNVHVYTLQCACVHLYNVHVYTCTVWMYIPDLYSVHVYTCTMIFCLQVMLVSLRAGGVGLNLIGGNHLFLLDMHWSVCWLCFSHI